MARGGGTQQRRDANDADVGADDDVERASPSTSRTQLLSHIMAHRSPELERAESDSDDSIIVAAATPTGRGSGGDDDDERLDGGESDLASPDRAPREHPKGYENENALASKKATCDACSTAIAIPPAAANPVCRICFEGQEESSEELCANLCACSGSMGFLHKACLNRWIMESKSIECEVCKQPFNLPEAELAEWSRVFAQHEAAERQRTFSLGVQQDPPEDTLALDHIQNRFLRSCIQRTWRNRGALNSGVIVLIGSSILVMMSLVVYHFLSPAHEEIIAGPLPPNNGGLQEPHNCTLQEGAGDKSAVGWLCGVPESSIEKGSCEGIQSESQPCGLWNHFTLLQSELPGCYFGHGSICYVALKPAPGIGGVCKNQTCIPFDEPGGEISPTLRSLARGMLTQGRCVACV